MIKNTKKKCICILVIFAICFSYLAWRVYYFSFLHRNELMVNLNAQNSSIEKTCDINYNVVDSKGKQLINFSDEYYAVINPYLIVYNSDSNINELYSLTYSLRNFNKDYDLFNTQIINTSQKLYWKIDKDTYDKISSIKNVKGFYPLKISAVDRTIDSDICSIITNIKKTVQKKDAATGESKDVEIDKSQDSLEMTLYNKFKNMDYPKRVFQNDASGNLLKIEDVSNMDSTYVTLTIDKDMVNKVKEVLGKKDYANYKQIGVVIMESSTGAIRAMVQKDDYQPNINLGIGQYTYLPGSIFKTIVEEAGLESKTISLYDRFDSKGVYSEHRNDGEITPERAYIISSNNAFSHIGEKVGYNNIKKYAKAQGLTDSVLGIDREGIGHFEVKAEEPIESQISNVSIGQLMKITPLEAISIPNTVINNGVYVKPYLIDGITIDGKTEKSNVETKRVLSSNTANIMANQMRAVVTDSEGTGELAYVKGVDIGGKTGTPERTEADKAGNLVKHDDGWFVGFYSNGGEYYSMVVFVEDIGNSDGGTTAAPLFRDIVANLSNKY
ncbi:MAG: penicillin-binding transpeptidase domain-containing protein [Bacillota bacterium]|nr:penicillin-binding transpeptidase domain-containing protein [Bacillota bacterium]